MSFRYLKNSGLVGLALLAAFFIAPPVFASVSFGQSYSTDSITKKNNSGVSTSTLSNYYQVFQSPFTGNLESVTVTGEQRYSGQANCSLSFQNANGVVGTFTTTTQGNQFAPSVKTTYTYVFPQNGWFGGAYPIVAGSFYTFSWNCSNGINNFDVLLYGSNTNRLSNAPFGYATTGSTTTVSTAYNGSYFQNGFTVTVSGSQSTVAFSSTPTSTCNFLNWNTSVQFSDTDLASCSSSGTCEIGVAWNAGINSSSTYPYNVNTGGALRNDQYSIAPQYWNTFNGGQWFVPNSNLFASGTVYNARAYLCSSNNTNDCMPTSNNSYILARSENYEFIVNGLNTCTTTYFDQNNIPFPVTTNSSTSFVNIQAQAQSFCDAFRDGSVIGSIPWGLCTVLIKTFVPDQRSLNNFVEIKTTLEHKPPFGYISAYSNALLSFENVTTTSAVMSTSTYAYTDITSTIASMSIVQTLRTAIEFIVWLGLGFYVYRRFKHFSLHG